MRRILFLTAVALAAAATATAAKDEMFNVDAFFGWGGYYRPMEWTPIEVNIQSDLTEPFEGILELTAQQDDLNRLNIRHAFVLTPDLPTHIPLVAKFAFGADRCVARIVNERERVFWENQFDLWNFATESRILSPISEADLLIGLIGNRKFGLLQLPQRSQCVSDGRRGKVYVQDKIPRMAPWDWTGYVSLDLLILYDADLGQLTADQTRAICDWVRNGGRLLIVVGATVMDSVNPILQMLPWTVGQPKQSVLDVALLARFPEGYRHLAYVQSKNGFTIKTGLPGLRGTAVEQLYAEGKAWLEGSAQPGELL